MTPTSIHPEGRVIAGRVEGEVSDSVWFVILFALFQSRILRAILGGGQPNLRCLELPKEHSEGRNKNFDFCICIPLNLCYGVYIPVEERSNRLSSWK